MVAESGSAPDCTFCGKAAAEVQKIIAGPGIYICDECVAKCNEILAADNDPSRARLPEWENMTAQQILGRLPRMAAVGSQVDVSLRRRIAELRTLGVTWAQIGAALGITRQSAWERFSAEDQLPEQEA